MLEEKYIPWIIIFCVSAFLTLLFRIWRRKRRFIRDMAIIDEMDGHEFEAYCADLLERNGFFHVKVTQGSGDQGVDILALKGSDRWAIQCKRYKNKLGNKPVQEVYTGARIYGCSRAAVMTNSYFTEGGIKAAKATGVELWDRDVLVSMIQKAKR